jgi:hypothetical protein
MTRGPMRFGEFNNAGYGPNAETTTLYTGGNPRPTMSILAENQGVEGTQSADYVYPTNLRPYGVSGVATGTGAVGVSGWANRGPFSRAVLGASVNGFAGYFDGKVEVLGALKKSGGGFRIDHPTNPQNAYLSHSFVESPEMLNVYCGTVTTDAQGVARVGMPDYFDALNRDFTYQLTAIGQLAQAIVESEIQGNEFTIRTNLPHVKVSWQVTGIRQDPWANANRLRVEEEKPEEEKGTYLHPEVHGEPSDRGVNYPVRRAFEEHEREIRDILRQGESGGS